MSEPTTNESPISTVDNLSWCSYEDKNGRCKKQALNLSHYCWKHLKDRDEWRGKLQQRKPNLEKSILEEAVLRGENFYKANLQQAQFRESKLQYSQFQHSILERAEFYGACLEDADLSEAKLAGARFEKANLYNCSLYNSELVRRLRDDEKSSSSSFGSDEFLCAEFLSRYSFWEHKLWWPWGKSLREKDEQGQACSREAEIGYKGLQKYFKIQGQKIDESWAAFKVMQMKRRQKRRLWRVVEWFLVESWGYGEVPSRVAIIGAFVITFFAFLYRLLPVISECPNQSLWSCLFMSVSVFTTLGFEKITPLPGFGRLFVAAEAVLGVLLMALLAVSITRRYGARG